MVKYLRKTIRDKRLVELEVCKTGCWIQLEDPTDHEILKISESLTLEHGHLTDALDPNEVPRLEEEDGIPYIFTRTPLKQNSGYITVPLLFVLGPTYLLTISKKESELFDKFKSQKIPFTTTQKIKLLIQMVKEVNNSYMRALNDINREVNALTHRIEAIRNKDILNLVIYEQTVNDFLNALVRTNTILNNLLSGKTIRLYEEDRDLVEDLSLASGQLIDVSKNTLQTIRNMRDAYSTIMTNNLNRVMKLFTSLTVVLTIPTIISSFFGMNVTLPLNQHPDAFTLIAFFAIGICALLIFIFYRKEWL